MLLRNRVLEWRTLHRWSVEQLAEKAGVSSWTISHLESEPSYAPQGRVMLCLCGAFHCELEALFWIDWTAPDLDGDAEKPLAEVA